MITISLCMIVKDEEKVLARCLDSARGAVDEIIIVDTGSTDGTKAVAGRYTDRVYDFEWRDDFSAARNFAFSKAVMDYQMWLDADDVLPPETLGGLLSLKKTLAPNTDIVAMKYVTHFNESGDPVLISTRERLMRREKNMLWLEPVHECIPLLGNVCYSELAVHHRPIAKAGRSERNIRIYSALEKSGASMSPRQQYYFARELKDHGQWAKSAYYFEKFLDSGLGWVEDNIAACYSLSICYNVLREEHKVLPILVRSFRFDAPRAEICSELGYYYKRAGSYGVALKWFELAAGLKKPDSLGFVLCDYWGYIPNIEACVCCAELGDFEGAKRFNEQAAVYKPRAAAVELNREFLARH